MSSNNNENRINDIIKYLKGSKDSKFTKDQLEAIVYDDNIIVSAGAGCGKTKVLVEKICQFIRVGVFKIDETIIMTFTNDATNEMKNRIKVRLNELYKSELNPAYRKNIYNAIIGISSASICTIDSLCRKIVDSNFERLDSLPVNYRMADDSELKVIIDKVFDDVIEDSLKNDKYKLFFDTFFEKSDENIKNSLLNAGIRNVNNIAWPLDQFDNTNGYSELEKEYNDFLKVCYLEIEKVKCEKGIINVSDLIHYALKILYDKEDNNIVFSDVALKMQSKIKYLFVDEYQDTSNSQEELIKAINGNFKSVKTFIVGDIKQSIYKFRNSRIKFFNDKLDIAEKKVKSDYDLKLVSLNDNFRSHEHIINFVNTFFDKIMTKNICNIDYNNGHNLNAKSSITEDLKNDKDDKVEINLLLNTRKEDNIPFDKDYQARFIARRIKDLHEIDGYSYNDIVILHKSPRNIARSYEKALKEFNIPIKYDKKTGFYDSYEIKLVISLLRIIDNPMQDIELLSVINTGLFNITLDEISIINLLKNKNENYYTVIKRILYAYFNTNESSDLVKQELSIHSSKLGIDLDSFINKLKYFIDTLNKYFELSRFKSAADIIDDLYTNLHLIEYVIGLDNRELAKENLLYFLSIARELKNSNYRDMYNFTSFVDKIIKKEVELGEAEVLTKEDTVRLISIHGSKGLQYPVVIMPGLDSLLNVGRHNNMNDYLYFDYDEGFSLKDMDCEERICMINEKRKRIVYKNRREDMEENIRLLYVAFTRPEKKLILCMKGSEFNDISDNVSKDKRYTEIEYFGSSCMEDINEKGVNSDSKLISDMISTIGGWKDEDKSRGEFKYYNLFKSNNGMTLRYCGSKEILEYLKYENDSIKDNKKDEIIKTNINIFEYPHSDFSNMKPKYSVSELKHANIENKEIINTIHTLIDSNEDYDKEIKGMLSGAALGDVFHKFMYLYDFDEKHIDTILDSMEVTDQDINKNDFKEKIIRFSNTKLYKEMKNAYEKNLLFREKRFMKSYDASIVKNVIDNTDTSKTGVSSIILQGVIDAFYINDNNEIVVLDYKTDFMNKKVDKENEDSVVNELIERYKIQIDTYADCLNKIMNKKIASKYIYSFKIDREIEIS